MPENPAEEFADRHYPLQEDMQLQRRVWRFERIGWGVLYLFIILTLLGLFSKGVLSKVRTQNDSGSVVVEYQRFERNGTISNLTLRVKAGKDGTAAIGLDGDFFNNFTIETIQPTPTAARNQGTGVGWVFQPDAEGWATVRLSMHADGVGLVRSAAVSADSSPVQLTQFIYP
jgi:hypothetical protein